MTYIELLCTTPARGKIVSYFASHPQSYITSHALARNTGQDRSGVTRILRQLLRRGFIKTRQDGQCTYYKLNPDLPFLQELKSMTTEVRR